MRRGGVARDTDDVPVREAGEGYDGGQGPTAAGTTGKLSKNAEEVILGEE